MNAAVALAQAGANTVNSAPAARAHVLVVDDDAGGRRLTRATLAKAGFAVSEAGDGQAALDAMCTAMPDLVLLDVSMPVMDGFTACAELRRLPGGERVPVVMMTGLDDTASIERAFEAGATDFITKPINWAVLPHRVRYMMRASAAINELQQNQEQIRRLAYYDPLTGLPNRVLFVEQLERALAQATRHQRRLAVMFVDLDNFKRVNDTLGHRAGDELLCKASSRLAATLRTADGLARPGGDAAPVQHNIARLGGDEFIVLLTDVQRPEHVATVAQRMVQTLAEPIVVQGTEVFVGGSVGVASFPEDGVDIDTLLMNADTAMYRAKAAGRGGFQLYDRSMNARALDRLHMETRLRRALERDEFVLHYQPRVDVVSGRIVGAEALIRWQDPERGLLPPAEFIPLVEDAGLVIPIGEWAIQTVCRQSAAWQAAGLQPVPVAVNLASTHLRERGLPARVARSLAEHGVQAGCLEIEVTESILLADPELSVQIAQELAAMGVKLSIDDFGTGYSSMGYLKKLPIAALKIDRSFVRDLETDPDDAAIVSAIVALAHSLKLKVVAEGVETPAQLAFLQSVRCDEYQGFLTSRAIGVAEFERLLRRRAQLETLFSGHGALDALPVE
ncbi:MAG: EAL domain-containing protein [Rubrivivax sp.]|nr:EAL domain-containing protein [Rubrivivax sp.]MCL4697452.1 EAL domain-containing protein [Burkholderiaceae bacterium]